ncbi:MAG TPA: hypothetical protein VE619_02060 [Nitrososphaeraceae archaeon]|nr:hypothetical protein [Nitrososphaeraceae archaeon]
MLCSKTSYRTLATSRLIRKFTSYGANTHKTKKQEEEIEERYSCWCFVLIDGTEFNAKIVHKGRGKFKILNDEYGGKHSNKIVDASDVIRCKIEI